MTAVFLLSFLTTGSIFGQSAADSVRLTDQCECRFASADSGRDILTADDAFTASLSQFDLQCRLKTSKDVTLADWKNFVGKHVCEWDRAEIEAVSRSIERIRARLATLRLPLPPTIRIVRTTGEEESNAAYTRAAAIVLPAKVLKYDNTQLDRLLVHELFHLISRQDGALRAKLYAIIGFEICEPITCPASLATRRITNPDAPLIDCTITLKAVNGTTYTGAPVLYSSSPQYDAKKGATLYQSMLFRLLVVEQRSGAWQPVLKNKEAVVINPRDENTFLERIGKNTNLIFHPDEILADNFVRLVMEDTNVSTPGIIEAMRRVLTAR